MLRQIFIGKRERDRERKGRRVIDQAVVMFLPAVACFSWWFSFQYERQGS